MGKRNFQAKASEKVKTNTKNSAKTPHYYDEKIIANKTKSNTSLAIFTISCILIATAVGIAITIGNNADNRDTNTTNTQTTGSTTTTTSTGSTDHPRAQMDIAGVGTLIIEFYPEYAPNTVDNFLTLANSGFYDGLTFHRVVADFVVQGGDPNGDGTGGPGYTIDDELIGNPLTHEVGAISMAHSGPNTAGSQFFFVLNEANCAHLDGVHTVFGKIITGLNLIFEIEEGDVMTHVFEL